MKNICLLIIFTTLIFSCSNNYKGFGDKEYKVFNNTHVHFNPSAKYSEQKADSNNIIRIANGRIVIKKLSIPKFERTTKANLKLRLRSAGDRWDKSGSCFIIPKNSAINLLSIEKGLKEFPKCDTTIVEQFSGIIPSKDYKPTIELMRFMTPFGVGFYSKKKSTRKPVYIPRFYDYVEWKQDVTDLISCLEGEVYVGVWIDTWTNEGYSIDLTLTFDESNLSNDKQTETTVSPLLNTVYYINGQKNVDLLSRKSLTVEYEIPKNAKNVRLEYITTGHGGHSGGDEFVQKENIISVDGKEIYKFIPWRDDCASFRRFNPSSGVWLIKDTAQYIDWKAQKYKLKEIEERQASSDLSRSNWCPGSVVYPINIPLLDIKPGKHKFTFSIPESQQAVKKKLNHWLISAYLVWDN